MTQHNANQHNTAQHSTTQHSSTQRTTAQHSTTQHISTSQHHSTQRNATQLNSTQLNSTFPSHLAETWINKHKTGPVSQNTRTIKWSLGVVRTSPLFSTTGRWRRKKSCFSWPTKVRDIYSLHKFEQNTRLRYPISASLSTTSCFLFVSSRHFLPSCGCRLVFVTGKEIIFMVSSYVGSIVKD